MQFIRYQHVERLGTQATDGILNGTVLVFPKLDGANAQVWMEDGVIQCGNRSHKLGDGDEFRGLKAYVRGHQGLLAMLTTYPHFRLHGEWLVPHSIKNYRDVAWNNFHVFDVTTDTDSGIEYIPYDIYKPWLDKFGITYVPLLASVEQATPDILLALLERNTYLMKDGVGEGLVIKRYDFVNKFGHTVWAKLISAKFRDIANHAPARIKGGTGIEDEIVSKFVTPDMIDKEYQKLVTEKGGWASSLIPALLGRVYHALITEEMWNILKKYPHRAVINFSTLRTSTIASIKATRTDLFGIGA